MSKTRLAVSRAISNNTPYLPPGICKLIVEYCFYLEYLHCPLSGQLFTYPVYINHPGIKPLVYERGAVKKAVAEGELEHFYIFPENIKKYLVRVPSLQKIIERLKTHSTVAITDLNKIVQKPQTNLEADLIENLQHATALRRTQFNLLNFLNNYDCRISGKTTSRQFAYLSTLSREKIQRYIWLVAGWWAVQTVLHDELAHPNPFLLLGSTLHWRNELLAVLDFALRVDGMNLNQILFHREYRHLMNSNPRFSIWNHLIKPLRFWINHLGSGFALETKGITCLSLLDLLFRTLRFDLWQIEAPLIPYLYPVIKISSKQTTIECKQIYHDPARILQPARDVDGFSESATQAITRRFGRFSAALLAAMVTYTATENPIYALLTFISIFNQGSLANALNFSDNRYILMPRTNASNRQTLSESKSSLGFK